MYGSKSDPVKVSVKTAIEKGYKMGDMKFA